MPRIKQAAQEMLNNVILPFWMSLKDETHGGYYGLVDFDLQVDKTAEKGCILNSRILWFFSEAAMLTGRADAAADIWHYITDKLVDKRPGGEWFWSVDASGVPASRQPIVEPWKCPYHNGRMCMELIRRDPDVTV